MNRRLIVAGALIPVAILGVGFIVGAQMSDPGRPVQGTCVDHDDGSLECHLVIAPAPSTSSPTTTTTTAPVTSPTTVPPSSGPATTTSTTTSPTTTSTAPPTTSATSPPTTAPPSGLHFSEDFSSPSAFSTRFEAFAGDFVDPQHHRVDWWLNNGGDTPSVVHGDHNMACGGPETVRDLDVHNPDWSQYFWYCAPSGPASGHVMTGFTTSGYVIFAFAPKQTFTNISKVCWDINATEEGGGKWTNMIVVPDALYRQFVPRLDYVTAGFNDPGGTGDFNIQAGDHPGTDVWGIKDFRGGQHFYVGNDMLMEDNTVTTTTDKASRFQHCVQNTSSSTSRLTVKRPNGSTSTYNLPRALPSGQVHVIFQDDMYDPVKRDGYSPSNVTWHWDNIEIG